MRDAKVKVMLVGIGLGIFTQVLGAPTNATSLVQVDSRDYGETNFITQAIELDRDSKTSRIKIIHDRRCSSVGSSLFVLFAFYEVAKARNAEFFINLKEWDDDQGNRIYIGGFTNTKDVDIKKEFGQSYSYTDDAGEDRDFTSVSKFQRIFEKMKAGKLINSSERK